MGEPFEIKGWDFSFRSELFCKGKHYLYLYPFNKHLKSWNHFPRFLELKLKISTLSCLWLSSRKRLRSLIRSTVNCLSAK